MRPGSQPRTLDAMDASASSLLTVGHSTRGIDDFTALLRGHGVATLIDIRRFPGSRRQPWFGREALAASLPAAGVAYVWIEALGGRRRVQPGSPNGGWRNQAFQGYADHMATDEFISGIERLLPLASDGRACVMCSEALPWRCHRWLLSDWLVAHGARVAHIVGGGAVRLHRLTEFALAEDDRLIYPPSGGDGPAR